MTKIQLDNLLRFSILFRSMNYKHQSPDYIKEKWVKYIDIALYKKSNLLTEVSKEYLTFWKGDEDLLTVVEFLHLNSKAYTLEPSTIIDNFSIFFKMSDIRKTYYNDLHYNLNKYQENWVVENRRDYNLSLLV